MLCFFNLSVVSSVLQDTFSCRPNWRISHPLCSISRTAADFDIASGAQVARLSARDVTVCNCPRNDALDRVHCHPLTLHIARNFISFSCSGFSDCILDRNANNPNNYASCCPQALMFVFLWRDTHPLPPPPSSRPGPSHSRDF